MTNFRYLQIIFLLTFSTSVLCFDSQVEKLRNTKETFSLAIMNYSIESLLEKYSAREVRDIGSLFYFSLRNYEEELVLGNPEREKAAQKAKFLEDTCDLKVLDVFIRSLKINGYSIDNDHIEEYLKLVRIDNKIDDVFYSILLALNKERVGLLKAEKNKSEPWNVDRYSDDEGMQKIKFDQVFGNFKTWPDGDNKCVFKSYVYKKVAIQNLLGEEEVSNKNLKKVNFEAYNQKVISLKTFRKLEFLRKDSEYLSARINMKRYLTTIIKVKDSMLPSNYESEVVDIGMENDFTSKKKSRWSTISRRMELYNKYDPTQIVMLAQILEKASRRMGNDPDVESSVPVIIQEFSFINTKGLRENYVERTELDTQSQYNYARKRMRMDMITLQNMQSFLGTQISHEDLITAALETGYINHEDIDYVLEYDDLWNPEMPAWYRLKNFCYNLARTSILFLPAPWNITGSVGLAALEGILSSKKRVGAYNDNPATFID